MRRAVDYRVPGSPGWWDWVLRNNTSPPARLELEGDEFEPEPVATPGPAPFDPQDWAWSTDASMASQSAPAPPAAPEPIREPISLDAPAEPWPDEVLCRRFDWRCDAGWVTLADGNLWAVPLLDSFDIIGNPIVREYVADFVSLEPNPGMGVTLADLADYYRWADEFIVRLSSVMAVLIGINYTFPDNETAGRLVRNLDIATWTDLVRRSVADVGREAVALTVARGIPVSWD